MDISKKKQRKSTQSNRNITSEIASVSQGLCKHVLKNLRSRLEECQECNGRHLDIIIFCKKFSNNRRLKLKNKISLNIFYFKLTLLFSAPNLSGHLVFNKTNVESFHIKLN